MWTRMACARAFTHHRYTDHFRRGNAPLRRPATKHWILDQALRSQATGTRITQIAAELIRLRFELKAIRQALEHSSHQRETAQARFYRLASLGPFMVHN